MIGNLFRTTSESLVARPGFFVLYFFENIQGHFFDDHFGIGAVQSVVFCAVHCFWSAVKYSEKDS